MNNHASKTEAGCNLSPLTWQSHTNLWGGTPQWNTQTLVCTQHLEMWLHTERPSAAWLAERSPQSTHLLYHWPYLPSPPLAEITSFSHSLNHSCKGIHGKVGCFFTQSKIPRYQAEVQYYFSSSKIGWKDPVFTFQPHSRPNNCFWVVP